MLLDQRLDPSNEFDLLLRHGRWDGWIGWVSIERRAGDTQ
jgi:hypothetical protein